MLKTLRVPRWEDFVIRRHDRNMWTFLGDGTTEREMLREKSGEGADDGVDLAPWMRNEDSEWMIDL